MNKSIITILLAFAGAVSCTGFLAENPKTFLSPDNYFKSQEQMLAAVNGLYTFADDIFDGDVEVGTHRFIFLEYMTGYGRRPRVATSIYLTQANLLTVTEENLNLEGLWRSWYAAIENCNYTIAGIEAASVQIPEQQKNLFLGEAYSLRAYYYFNLVRLWESVPLKTEPTTSLSDVEIPLSSAAQVYAQIESDLVKAEELMAEASWSRTDGHIGRGAVKALLSKVYLSSVKDADMVYMLEEGRLIEQGTHEELMGQNEKYARMYQMQAKNYQPEESDLEVEWDAIG